MSGPMSLLGGGMSRVVEGGYARNTPGRYTPQKVPPVLTSSGGHRNGQYASYWNAFLLFITLRLK